MPTSPRGSCAPPHGDSVPRGLLLKQHNQDPSRLSKGRQGLTSNIFTAAGYSSQPRSLLSPRTLGLLHLQTLKPRSGEGPHVHSHT